ncbi:MAG: histidine phosphatase family protein [Chloroflexi bacterium]|nr:histidine phosphatase family protein [Chloroflexota bacterium]
MKTLILIRHAKSSWKNAYLVDIDRPLNKRGKRDAPVMGKRLAEWESTPDLMISSPATRALTTAEIIAHEIEYTLEDIVVDERIYGADVADWFQIIHDLDDGWDCVMCFGHNPGITDLFNQISSYYVNNVPTCGILKLVFDVETWKDVGRVEPMDVHYDYPKKTDSD